MKPIVTVSKNDLDKHPDLIARLSELCEHIEEDIDSFAFFPRPKASMDLICLLLDREIVYKLGFESTVDKTVTGDRASME